MTYLNAGLELYSHSGQVVDLIVPLVESKGGRVVALVRVNCRRDARYDVKSFQDLYQVFEGPFRTVASQLGDFFLRFSELLDREDLDFQLFKRLPRSSVGHR